MSINEVLAIKNRLLQLSRSRYQSKDGNQFILERSQKMNVPARKPEKQLEKQAVQKIQGNSLTTTPKALFSTNIFKNGESATFFRSGEESLKQSYTRSSFLQQMLLEQKNPAHKLQFSNVAVQQKDPFQLLKGTCNDATLQNDYDLRPSILSACKAGYTRELQQPNHITSNPDRAQVFKELGKQQKLLSLGLVVRSELRSAYRQKLDEATFERREQVQKLEASLFDDQTRDFSNIFDLGTMKLLQNVDTAPKQLEQQPFDPVNIKGYDFANGFYKNNVLLNTAESERFVDADN